MYVRKRGNKWRVEINIMINGEYVRESKSFDVKAEAMVWGAEREKELLSGRGYKVDDSKTFKDAIEYYLENETPKKRSARNENFRLKYFLRCPFLNVNVRLSALTLEMFEKYIEHRSQEVMTSTVNKEISIMRSTIRLARKKKWMNHNPFEGIERLKEPPPRNRRISESEIRRILEALTYEEGIPPTQARHRIAIMFLLALETAMRIGEICDLDWNNIYLQDRYLTVLISKNGDARDIPLSSRAVELLEMMKAYSRTLVHEREIIDEFGRKTIIRAMPVFYKDYRASADKASALFKNMLKKPISKILLFMTLVTKHVPV